MYVCAHCGRLMKYQVPHRCDTGYRKRHLKFIEVDMYKENKPEIMITKSKDFKQEYCCTIVRIGAVEPIQGSDFLGTTMVEGRTIVVRKDQTHEGDVMFYVSNESQVDADFLRVNNCFEDKTMNADTEKKGYINKYGRIRMVKLRGQLSMGILFGLEQMQAWLPELKDFRPERCIGEDFDTVCGHLFVKAYVPPCKENQHIGTGKGPRSKKAKFERIIPGEFQFHYDTKQLQREISRIRPDDKVTISVKEHGTSLVMGNVRTLQPRWGGPYSRVFPHLPKFLQFIRTAYDVIYSSRTVIKNPYYNSRVTSGYYGTDVWGEYYKLLRDFIPEGYTIYGEIVGYVSGDKMIQKGYDYGCEPGHNALMIYRVSIDKEEGRREMDVSEVATFTIQLRKAVEKAIGKEASNRIKVINVLWHGTLADLYPGFTTGEHWHANVLEALKMDTKHFGMEQDEPMCKNNVPREGICLRIDNDPVNECFKLKTLRFLGKEAELMDKGEVDMEMADNFQ